MKTPNPARKLNKWLASEGLDIEREFGRKRSGVKSKAWYVKLVDSGTTMLVVPVRHHDSHRAGCKTITEARKTQIESWPVEAELLLAVRGAPPRFVLLFETDTGDQWISDYEDWFDRVKRGKAPNVGRWARSIFLKTCHMQHRQADPVLTAIKR